MSRMWGNTEEEWIFRWDQGEGEACVFSIHLGGCYELVIRMVRLRAESMRPPLTGVRILPPSGGDGPWWGASMWRVKRLLVAVSMVAGCRGWRQTLPCPLASAWLRRGLGGDGSPDVASCAWPGLRGWWGWSATTSTCLFPCTCWETSRSRSSSFGRALPRVFRPSQLKVVAQCSLLAGARYR